MLANYINICKFNNKNNNKYKQVRTKIKQVIKATKIIELYKIRDNSSEISLTKLS